MRNKLSTTILISILTTISLLGVFYFYTLKPKLELPKKLNIAKKGISTNHFNLLQNRIGLVGLATIDPSGKNLGMEKESLLKKAIETNEKGLKDLQNPPIIKKVEEVSGISTQKLFEENKRILDDQKSLLDQLKTIGDINKNLFNYSPVNDVGRLDLANNDERGKIIERTYNAMEGIGNISNKLVQHTDEKHVGELIKEISNTKSLMERQIAEIEDGDYTTASLTFLEVYNSFIKMKELGLNIEKALIHSPKSVQLITDQTNLLLKYEFLLTKINEVQKGLPQINFYSLF